MDRFGRKAMNVPGFSILCLAMCLMGLTAFMQVPFPAFVAVYLLLHAANAATSGNMQTLGSDHAPANARGRFYGVFQLLGSTGQPTGTSGFAALSATVGSWMGFLFLAAVSALTAFILGTQVHDRVRDDIKTAQSARSK
ncbi:MAG: major facilitator superfamily 1 [Chloroflexi bacterium]|nr:major facilitator superfamily 1 [Chloroflexota bacterium]